LRGKSAEAAIDAVVRDDQVVNGRDQRLAVAQLELLHGNVAAQHVAMRGAGEIGALRARAEVREIDGREIVARISEAEPQFHVAAVTCPLLQVPLTLVAPAEADRPKRSDEIAAGIVIGDGLPLGVVRLVERTVKV